MKRLDFNCYCGNWPFFRTRYNTVEKISQLHSRCSIEGGFISAIEAIFYQDPYEAELQLAKQLEGTAYMHAMTLNPMIPGWKNDLDRGVRELNIKAVRLIPGYHGYSLSEPAVDAACEAIRAYNLPLILTLRILDERTTWMVNPRKIELEEISAFLDSHKDMVTLITCARARELQILAPQFEGRTNLFTDVSGLKDSNYIVETISQCIGSDRIVYGSSAPLLELQSTTIIVDRAKLPEDTIAQIFSGNKFLNLL